MDRKLVEDCLKLIDAGHMTEHGFLIDAKRDDVESVEARLRAMIAKWDYLAKINAEYAGPRYQVNVSLTQTD